ncbi:uncharacterized protein LOC106778213 [Vigna radiata var. radiata]|uniref:Uncharacterized protein LOC106778213 n=1 Tax=Vigna radiata var. radiata TaxID=3916 RepID=A0A1S3VTD6_VIGRR|nr:uncharacterized protein LOC106778213 [Vigna radiata var. radiata]XP_022631821.1 uncharacterized protein LOC106778213 [Vigna radiata var. radiata]
MEGRVVTTVAEQIEAVEVALAETKAETVFLRHETGTLRQKCEMMRQDIQAILTILKDRKIENRGVRRDGSESSVNDNSGGTGDDGGQNGAGRTGALINWRKRVDLPMFEGGEPWNWMSRVEKFFEVQKVEEEEKMQLAFISMEGYAGSWFRFWREKTKNYSWEGLKRALGIRFGGGTKGTVYEKLLANRQTGPVEDYVRDFEVLVGQTTQIPKEQVLGYFMAGLREEVSDHVRPHDPPDLMTVMRVARDVEKLCSPWKTGGGTGYKNQNAWGRSAGVVTRVEPSRETAIKGGPVESVGSVRRETNQGGGDAKTTGGGRDRGSRNLAYAEYLKRREEGKCFRCGGPFSLGHRCPERGLRMMIMVDEEENEEGEKEPAVELAGMELSALLAGGLTTSETMKLRGRIGNREVLVLIDSGVSHNFISKSLVEELGMAVKETQPYFVSLGNGQKRRISGCCEPVVLELEDTAVVEKFYLFELGGVEVILGIEWLKKLGEVMVDWGKLTMVY